MSTSSQVTLSVLLHRDTAGAVLVSLEDDSGTVWLPRASIFIAPERGVASPNRHRKRALARLSVTLPRQLALQKGLLAGAHEGQGRLL